MKTFIFLLFFTNLLPAQEKLKEAIIDILQLDESNTIREGIDLIPKAALKNDKFFALHRAGYKVPAIDSNQPAKDEQANPAQQKPSHAEPENPNDSKVGP